MNENVVALQGCKLPTPDGEVVTEVIDLLCILLDLAKSGRLVALAVSTVEYDGTPTILMGAGYKYKQGTANDLICSALRAQKRLQEDLL